MAKATELIIVAGKLGSGKTSLIEPLLLSGDAGNSTAVIVNEAGAINIDRAILTESARGVPLAKLSNGCVCCSLTDDLVITVEAVFPVRTNRSRMYWPLAARSGDWLAVPVVGARVKGASHDHIRLRYPSAEWDSLRR
jgi:hypothetical protein